VERFEVTPEELTRFRLRAGDVLVVEGNGSLEQIGRSAVFPGLEGDWIHQNHVIRVRFDEQAVLPRFASLYLSSTAGMSQMVEKASSTSGLHTLSKGKVEALEIPVPPTSVQRTVLGSLEASLATARWARQAAEAQLSEIATLPAALLRRAFSGEL
jgi:type I restriction enzyme S subunit